MLKTFAAYLLTWLLIISNPSCTENNIDFLAENIKAHGGIDALNEIHSKKLTGEFIIRQEQEISFTIILKRPNFIRVESEHVPINLVSASDGKKSWWINPLKGINQPTEMPPLEASRLLDLQLLYWGYLRTAHAAGYDIQYHSKEVIADDEYYILKINKDNDIHNLYLDANSFLERRIVGKLKGYDVKAETVFSNYKRINGILMAHKIEFFVNDRKDVETNIDKIELNIDVDDSIFRMPLTLMNIE